MKAIAALIIRTARENSGWSYSPIDGELMEVGHRVADDHSERLEGQRDQARAGPTFVLKDAPEGALG